jgi:triphosphoribosyl-dephospho-CoA synthase
MQTEPQTDTEHCLQSAIFQACLIEATARKPGNVHPDASFEDLTYQHFVQAAEAVAPVLACSARIGVGPAVLESVTRCRQHCGSNVNLGIVLLIAPLAAVPEPLSLADGIERVLDDLTIDDSKRVYEAIRIAKPGGLGQADIEDVSESPTLPLRQIMKLAAERDSIAAEYANGFPIVLGRGLPFLAEAEPRLAADWEQVWEQLVIHLHLSLMAEYPDTLIARKCGKGVAVESADRARRVLEAGWPDDPASIKMLTELNGWLRADGHRRNPGTTADLVAASLFAAIFHSTS